MEIKERLGLAKKISESKGEKATEFKDSLARMVKQDFDAAVRHRASYKFGDYTAEEVLNNCYSQYYGEVPCEIREAFGNMPVPSLTQLKVSALNAWIRDLLFGSGGIPFTVEPTPVPELNKEIEDETLARVKEVIFGDVESVVPSTKVEMQKLIRDQKKHVRDAMLVAANNAAKAMETVMWDQCVDGGYDKAMKKFLQDFCIYPYAVLEGPVPEVRTNFVWKGKSLEAKDEVVYAVNHVSPFDFFWSSDSTDAQDGSYVIVRKRYSRKQLVKMAKLDSYIKENVVAALEHFTDGSTHYNWLGGNPENSNDIIPWDGKTSLEVLKYYGAVRGSVLKEYGLTDVENGEYYECIIHTLGCFTLKVIINPNPYANKRPIYVTSYEKTGNGIMGFGISQKVREVERAFQSCLRGMIKNMEYSSGPIGEVDFSRIQQWITDDQVGDIEPFTVNPVDPDPVGGGRPAYMFHNFPNNTASLSNVCQWFMSLADIMTQIPASIHGQPVGTGANRTFRGMSMLYGNALKGVQSGITNIDDDVVSPFATALYMYNLKYNNRDDIKGDAKVVARGASGLMEKELKKNDMLEAAQIVASLAQTGRVKPEAIDKAVDRVLQALDLVDYDMDDVMTVVGEGNQIDPMAMAQQQVQQQPQPEEVL
jgi:hypothetical protein